MRWRWERSWRVVLAVAALTMVGVHFLVDGLGRERPNYAGAKIEAILACFAPLPAWENLAGTW